MGYTYTSKSLLAIVLRGEIAIIYIRIYLEIHKVQVLGKEAYEYESNTMGYFHSLIVHAL